MENKLESIKNLTPSVLSKKYTIDGYDYLEKEVKEHSKTASKIYLPADWHGKKVAVIRLEE